MSPSIFHVWRRSDGYVNATNGYKPSDCPEWSFEHLLSTDDWSEAEALIRVCREYPTAM